MVTAFQCVSWIIDFYALTIFWLILKVYLIARLVTAWFRFSFTYNYKMQLYSHITWDSTCCKSWRWYNYTHILAKNLNNIKCHKGTTLVTEMGLMVLLEKERQRTENFFPYSQLLPQIWGKKWSAKLKEHTGQFQAVLCALGAYLQTYPNCIHQSYLILSFIHENDCLTFLDMGQFPCDWTKLIYLKL